MKMNLYEYVRACVDNAGNVVVVIIKTDDDFSVRVSSALVGDMPSVKAIDEDVHYYLSDVDRDGEGGPVVLHVEDEEDEDE